MKLYMRIVCGFMGIFFIVTGILILKNPKEYETTTGTIVRIDEKWDTTTDQMDYKPYVDYQIGNEVYKEVPYPSYNSSMKVGSEVTVYYTEEDHTDIEGENYQMTPYIIIIGGVLTIVGVFISTRR